MTTQKRPVFVWAKDLEAGDRIQFATTQKTAKGDHQGALWTAVVQSIRMQGIWCIVTFENGDFQEFAEYSYVQYLGKKRKTK